ncbi:unnamed protein product [Urochloa decumbens]|uniref:DUF6598 domain-containing protein n=1 Tax=Urochloa decumbens TaxID=240449 RepID=A0ABC9DW28_9POAL
MMKQEQRSTIPLSPVSLCGPKAPEFPLVKPKLKFEHTRNSGAHIQAMLGGLDGCFCCVDEGLHNGLLACCAVFLTLWYELELLMCCCVANNYYIFGEAVSELEKRSKGPCYPDEENCMHHLPSPMIQIFSLRLAKTPVNSGSIQLYGYMAARDDMDGLLNYVFNRSRDNPLIVEQGSHMEMTGPKRGIVMLSDVLMEFDMKIKTGEKEEHDLQLIDGVEHFSQRISTRPFTLRYNGTNGAVDMDVTLVDAGMEAAIEVVVSEVQRAFHLSLSSFVSYTEELKEFQLFHGTIGELVRRYVVAVLMETIMHLKFKVCEKGSGDAAHYCSFDSNYHGCVHRQIKFDMATILVKVTVSPSL